MSESTGRKFTITPRVWAGVAIAALAVAFILQNRQPVAVNLLALTVTAPLWTALAGVFLAGVAAGWLVARRRN